MTGIRGFEGLELFPSVEIIDRLYPETDKYLDFPIPIHITEEDLVRALNGKYITRVIYLENPRKAIPVTDRRNHQRTLVVGMNEDPLKEARELGRPMAIVRIGSRTPESDDSNRLDSPQRFGSPRVVDFSLMEKKPIGDGSRLSPDGLPWPLDEYLFDGGDRNRKTRIGGDFSVKGLDTEDTVVHFDTLQGERKVKESNRVLIYAPRFAAIEKTFGILSTHQNQKFMGANNREGLVKQEYVDKVIRTTQQFQPKATLMTKSAGTFVDETKGLNVRNMVRSGTINQAFKLHEDFQIVRLGRMKNNESLRLDIGMQAAQEWDHYTAIQVVVDSKKASVAQRVQNAQELLTNKPIPGSSKVRIIKLANKSHAKSGDIVEFTIRFDNTGTKKVGNVTIIDNLTTRLELVKDSSSCDLKHHFLTQENEGDSKVLRWEIVDPLDPGQGGVIRFRCKVR